MNPQQPGYPPQPQRQLYPAPQQGYVPQPYQQPPYQQPYPIQPNYAFGPRPLPFIPADFGLRFIAWILDYVFVGFLTGAIVAVLMTVGLIVGYGAGSGGGMVIAGMMLWALIIPVAILTFFVYRVKFETGPMQATPAKRLLGLKVVDQNGGPITAGQSIGRALSMIFLSSMFLGLGYFLALCTEKKQALHDLIASTIVIKA